MRVQGLPETFRMPYQGNVADCIFGNSVPCLLVRAILVKMLEAYAAVRTNQSTNL